MKKLLTKTNQKGITLVALVITIIVLLILAGISIQAITNQEIFAQANRAKKETQRAQVTEWLNFKLMEEQMYNPTGTAEEIIEATRVATYGNTELEKMGKNLVVDENTSTIEDGELVDVYFYVQVDEDVYKVEIAGVQFIGEAGKFPPVIKLESITSTTNSITVKIKVSRNEEGTLEIYKKEENDTEYTREKIATGEEAKGLEYTFTGLEQNKKYSVKIVATAKNGQTKENTTEITTSKQLVNEIKITPENTTLAPGETLDFTVTISPEYAYNKAITWNSSNPEVATINQNGQVTAVAEGTTTITAIAQDGSNVKGSCTIKVEDRILYLYNEGNECESVTGGWERMTSGYTMRNAVFQPNGTYNVFTKNSDNLQATSWYVYSVLLSAKNIINFRGYSKMYVESSSQCSDKGSLPTIFISNEPDLDKNSIAEYDAVVEGDSYIINEFDISNVNTSAKIFLQAYSGRSWKVKKLWLEK